MPNLKNNLLISCFSYILLLGCSTSNYLINKEIDGKTEILVTPDRVSLQCEHIYDYTGNAIDPYGFMIHVLGEENTVLTVNQGNLIGKDDCLKRLNKIGQILTKGKKIYIGGIGNLNNKPRIKEDNQYFFPNLGRFNSNGRVLQYMVIWNEHGQCFNAYTGDRKPCPSDEFPIEN